MESEIILVGSRSCHLTARYQINLFLAPAVSKTFWPHFSWKWIPTQLFVVSPLLGYALIWSDCAWGVFFVVWVCGSFNICFCLKLFLLEFIAFFLFCFLACSEETVINSLQPCGHVKKLVSGKEKPLVVVNRFLSSLVFSYCAVVRVGWVLMYVTCSFIISSSVVEDGSGGVRRDRTREEGAGVHFHTHTRTHALGTQNVWHLTF